MNERWLIFNLWCFIFNIQWLHVYMTVSFTSGGSRSARSNNRPSTSNWQTISHKISTGRHSVWRFSIMISAPSFQGTDHFIFMGICFWNKMAWLWILHENNLTKLHMKIFFSKTFFYQSVWQIDWLAIYMMVSFSGGVKHRPTASNWQTLPYIIRATMHHSSNLLEKTIWIVLKNLSNSVNKFGWDKNRTNRSCIR